MVESAFQNQETPPSLLRQIVDEVDGLSEIAKAEVLHKIKMQQALELARKADNALEGKFKSLPKMK